MSPTRPSSRSAYKKLLLLGLAAFATAGGLAAYGIVARARNTQDLQAWADQHALPAVALVQLTRGASEQSLILPGTIQPVNKAALHARVSGYLKSWSMDIGAEVKAGETLAIIDAPDLDQQLAQAKATLGSAKAGYDIATITANRYKILGNKQIVSQQVTDQSAADAVGKEAVVDAAAANVRQLEAMQSFKTIVSPFDGVVTARNTDVGALINAGNSAGQELFEVSDLKRVRIYVQVPQAYSAQLVPGLKATFELPQYPGKKFDAVLATTSKTMNANSRRMLIELRADNADGKLLGGTYCQVTFHIPVDANMVYLPATALMPVNQGVQVATLDSRNKIAFRSIQLGRDFGDSVEVTAGLTTQDRVIDSPPETLQTGDLVELVPAPQANRASAAPKN